MSPDLNIHTKTNKTKLTNMAMQFIADKSSVYLPDNRPNSIIQKNKRR